MHSISRLSLLFLILLGSTYTAYAQGVIVPGPCQRCPQPVPLPRPIPLPAALPVKSIKIDTKIVGQVATTHVEQTFRNDTDATLEGTFFFPIPENASIVEFAIWDGDRRLVGEVRSREEARRIYDEIVRRMRDPGLLEYAGKDLFQASIFPIPPRSDKKLEIKYTQVLSAEGGTASYRYPLGTGRNVNEIGTVAGSVQIESKEPIRNVYSPSHAIEVRNPNERQAQVSFEVQGKKEPQDFQLFYNLSKQDFGLSLVTYREAGKDGYFLLIVSPKADWSEQEYIAKDIVFVIDTSGSMADAGKMDKAKAALLFGIKSLRREDRFNVIAFAGEERLMESGLISADDRGRARGEEFVNGLRPTGGTNINAALLAALKQFEGSERPKLLVFITDGLPTVGETNVGRIVENAHSARTPGIRLFTFGVGYDVNTALLDKLAAENNGVADYVEPKEDLEIKVSNFFAKVSHPVLTDLRLEMGGVKTDLIYPRRIPDLFKGTQITLIGRYTTSSDMRNVRITVSGKSGNSERTFLYDALNFPLKSESNDFLPRLWATRRVGWLMEQIRTNGEQKELKDEIVDLGTRYGIVTPYTSYLALEPGAAPPADITQGTSRSETRILPRDAQPTAQMAADAAKATTGAVAVQQSRRARNQQESTRFEKEADDRSVRTAGGKTFYLREGTWTDAEYDPSKKLPETAVRFGSDDYFALISKEPRLAEYLALGEQVVVVYNGRVYRVRTTN